MSAAPERFLEAARRGVVWILEQQRDDGSFCDPSDGIGAYYKVPYALGLTGHTGEAMALARWIAEHHFTSDGEFGPDEAGSAGARHERWPTYRQAWLVLGLHRLGRWDMSLLGAEFLLRFQLSGGGFYATEAESRFVEPVCTSWSGLAVLATGHVKAAGRAGDALVSMIRAQPDPNRFYFRMTDDGELLTEVPSGEELFYFVDAGKAEQIYYNPGIALIFLTNLYRATGVESYLSACHELLEFTERCAGDAYRFPPSGKVGCGCALLYELTGREEARRAACALGEYLLETQTPQGTWELPDAGPYRGLKHRGSPAVALDITSEFSVFLTEIAARL